MMLFDDGKKYANRNEDVIFVGVCVCGFFYLTKLGSFSAPKNTRKIYKLHHKHALYAK